MSELMTLDTLTGIANRGYGVGQVDIEISRSTRNHSPLVLLLFNINNFRRYNEVFGHDAGDEILVAIARQFQLQLRSIDTVCRYAGDRFMVIAPGTDADGAQIVCQRIIQKTSAIFESRSDENAIPLQFSSHIVLFNVGESSDQLLYRLEHNV
jgi:diguanylate cyclase (GGDEF)-like protein